MQVVNSTKQGREFTLNTDMFRGSPGHVTWVLSAPNTSTAHNTRYRTPADRKVRRYVAQAVTEGEGDRQASRSTARQPDRQAHIPINS